MEEITVVFGDVVRALIVVTYPMVLFLAVIKFIELVKDNSKEDDTVDFH